MGLIKSIKLYNFQSHRESQISFDDGLTVIIGQTDQGKSAIIRALKWVLYNEPRGSEFVRVGTQVCRVTLEMKDGSIIIRERDRQRNRYILIKNGIEEIFEGFGNSVPFEIIQAHGIPKLYIDRDSTSTINLAEQLEAPFMVSESGSNRAKALGRLVGLHIIDAAQRTTIRDIADAEQQNKLIDKEITVLKNELTDYKDIHILAERIVCMKAIVQDLNNKKACLIQMSEIKNNLEPTEIEIDNTKKLLFNLKGINEVETYILTVENLSSKHCLLLGIRKQLQEVTDSLEIQKKIMVKTEDIGLAENRYYNIVNLDMILGKLINVRNSTELIDTDFEHNTSILKQTQGALKAQEVVLEAENMLETLKRFTLFYRQLTTANEQISLQEKELKIYDKAKKAEEYLLKISKIVPELSILNNKKSHLLNIMSSKTRGESYLKDVFDNLDKMAKEYGIMLDRFSRCPTCLNPIDKETTHKIVSGILRNDFERVEPSEPRERNT